MEGGVESPGVLVGADEREDWALPRVEMPVPWIGVYLRLIDSCITQLKAQGPSRTCTESKGEVPESKAHDRDRVHPRSPPPGLGFRV